MKLLAMFVKIIPTRSFLVRKTSLKEISFRSYKRQMNLVTAQVVMLIITNIKHLFQIIKCQTFRNFEIYGKVFISMLSLHQ